MNEQVVFDQIDYQVQLEDGIKVEEVNGMLYYYCLFGSDDVMEDLVMELLQDSG